MTSRGEATIWAGRKTWKFDIAFGALFVFSSANLIVGGARRLDLALPIAGTALQVATGAFALALAISTLVVGSRHLATIVLLFPSITVFWLWLAAVSLERLAEPIYWFTLAISVPSAVLFPIALFFSWPKVRSYASA